MNRNYDIGIQEDFDNMTEELGREVTIFTKDSVLNYESQEGEDSALGAGVKEIVFMQELDSTHEVVTEGLFKVGDVRFEFKSDSIAEEEAQINDGFNDYKILKLTIVKNMSSNKVLRIFGFGRKLPER